MGLLAVEAMAQTSSLSLPSRSMTSSATPESTTLADGREHLALAVPPAGPDEVAKEPRATVSATQQGMDHRAGTRPRQLKVPDNPMLAVSRAQ